MVVVVVAEEVAEPLRWFHLHHHRRNQRPKPPREGLAEIYSISCCCLSGSARFFAKGCARGRTTELNCVARAAFA